MAILSRWHLTALALAIQVGGSGCVRTFSSSGGESDAAGPSLDLPRYEAFVPPDAYPHVDKYLVPDGGCPVGTIQCGNECVDPMTDHRHCKACNQPCSHGQDCVNGSCVCKAGGLCTGCCVDDVCHPLVTGQNDASCGMGGAPCKSCDDKQTCTQDTCNAGKCIHGMKAGFCYIDSTCFKNGAVSPADPCKICDSQKSTTTWSGVGDCVGTFAGSGKAGFLNGPADQAQFFAPSGLALGAGSKVIYVADRANNCIRSVSAGVVTTVAGSCGKPGFANGAAAKALFNHPENLVQDKQGVLYVSDSSNHCIRAVNAGQVSTLAGVCGVKGNTNGALSSARFHSPAGIAVDQAGVLYVADINNYRIRRIDVVGGKVTTMAGSGQPCSTDGASLTACFNLPTGVTAGLFIYIAEMGGNKIRKLYQGTVTTVAGQSYHGFMNGSLSVALFYSPVSVATDTKGDIFVADAENYQIRKIDITANQVTTVAGSGPGFKNGPVNTALFGAPADLVLDLQGRIYVADRTNNRIRIIYP